jgi:hypothetical protein
MLAIKHPFARSWVQPITTLDPETGKMAEHIMPLK